MPSSGSMAAVSSRPRAVPASRGLRGDERFRPDIEGLRAVAVVAVVLFHASIGALSGGYVGVDVFYVISGFLITDHLWREVDRSGGLSFGGFYARRARRLLPAAMVVLVATMAVSAAVLPPLQVRSVWKDGLYCALYAGNFRFAATRTDYLANAAPSPFQHFWSLGVEEQFYLVWPLVLVAASLIWWRHRPSRASAVVALGALSAASLTLCINLTGSDQPAAFFLLPARAWELGLGGLIALAAPELRRLPRRARAVMGWAGLVAIAVACLAYGPSTPFPGVAAVLPVAGAAGVIAAGLPGGTSAAAALLGRPTMRAVGRISYSWYLWHYPVLVLVPVAVGHSLPALIMLALAAGSGVLAVLTFRFVEEPARRARWLAVSPRRTLTTGLALSGAGVLACAGAAVTIPSVHGHGRAPVASIRQTPTRRPAAAARTPSATTLPPAVEALQAAQSQVVAAITSSAATRTVPANLVPSLSNASSSEAAPMVDGCLDSFRSSAVPTCQFGDTAATRSIVLFGDSHASMWFPAVDAFANANGYRLYVWTKAACPPIAITLFSPVLDRTWTECSQWYAAVQAQIAATHPALVVLALSPNYGPAYHLAQNGPDWQAGVAASVTGIRRSGSRVLMIGQVPGPPDPIPDCLSANLDSVTACEFSPVARRVAGGGLVGVDRTGDTAEAATVRAAGGTYADVYPWFCTATVCDVIVDNLLVYRDNSHITVPYADYLAPLIGDEMTLALGS
ncbi:MAG TPA: SGNH hydrolase domain-containing protein [Acidimicrobiales bacterium]|nr:SGNH hydrolase domain-containing protein [Acidimicrobiales bacterium]